MTEYCKQLNLFIKESLTSSYSPHSFHPQEKFNGFFRKEPGFTNEVFIGPNAVFESRINFAPNFRVFNDQLEAAKSHLLGSHKVFGGTMLYRSQGRFVAKQFGVTGHETWIDYKVGNRNDAVHMISHHTQFMTEVGWKFFETTSTLEGINQFLNTPFLNESVKGLSEDEKAVLIGTHGIGGMVNGIVAAHLVRDKELEKLISHYRDVYFPDHIQETLNILLEAMK